MTVKYELDRDDLARLPYEIICETTSSAIWETGKRKRLFKETFTDYEKQLITKIKRQSYEWFLIKGLPDSATMTATEINLWRRLATFCADLYS